MFPLSNLFLGRTNCEKGDEATELTGKAAEKIYISR